MAGGGSSATVRGFREFRRDSGRGDPRSAGADRVDLLVGGKPPGRLFRERQPSVDGNLEHAAYPRHQFDFGAVFFLQSRPRTEGPRFIVSRLAPLDPDLHPRPPSRLALRKHIAGELSMVRPRRNPDGALRPAVV